MNSCKQKKHADFWGMICNPIYTVIPDIFYKLGDSGDLVIKIGLLWFRFWNYFNLSSMERDSYTRFKSAILISMYDKSRPLIRGNCK